jgi:hypothetical protein
MAVKTTHASRQDYLEDVNSYLNDGYKYVLTDSGGYLVFHKPDEPQVSVRQTNVSIGDPVEFANLIRETVINNGGTLGSAGDLPQKPTSFNEWYGVRDIP